MGAVYRWSAALSQALSIGWGEHGTEQDLSLEHRLQDPGCDTVSWGQMLNLGPFLYESIKWTLTLDLTPA